MNNIKERSALRGVNFDRLFNPLNAELNPIRHLLALAGAHHFVHVSRIRVNDVVSPYSLGTLQLSVLIFPWHFSVYGTRFVSDPVHFISL
jgi:hypothetical protein